MEPLRQIAVSGNTQIDVPSGCQANLDDFVLFGPPVKFHAGRRISCGWPQISSWTSMLAGLTTEIDSPGLSYNFSMLPKLLSAIESQETVSNNN